MRFNARFLPTALVWTVLLAPATPVLAQLEPPSTGGIVALQQELRMLGHNKRVLMIGAHPDDEDTELLTLLVRGMGAEAAYLSLNRGEGGQNLIGPELGEALGLIRTEELLAARRLDGARQYFTRAYDFGYTKSLEETWRFWRRDSVLKDALRVVREFRPQIIVSIFSGTPRDGHGQHQAAGWVAREVFRIAEDSARSPDAGAPWRPVKLYQSTRFDSAATTLALEGGLLDPAVGQTYRQIAMRGRSLHRSQDMGQLQRIGPSQIRLRLVEDRSRSGAPDLWAGIDTTFAGGFPAARLDSLRQAAWSSGSSLAGILERLSRDLESRTPRPCSSDVCPSLPGIELLDQHRHIRDAAAILSGVVIDAVSNDERVVPGQVIRLVGTAWNASASSYRICGAFVTPEVPAGTQGCDSSIVSRPGQLDTFALSFRVPDDAPYAQPYFLREPRDGAMYVWPRRAAGRPNSIEARDEGRGRPFEDADFRFVLTGDDAASGPGGSGPLFDLEREVTFRVNDQAFGERRRPIIVVPRVDVRLEPGTEVWPTGPAPHDFTVILVHGARDSTSGTVTIEVPAGWPPVPPQRFAFAHEDEREAFRFTVRPPAGLRPGSYAIRAVATDSRGRRHDQGIFAVDYPHIRPRSWTRPSVAMIAFAPLEMARLRRVGYIRGASDMVPEALAGVGVPVELLDRATLERGDLSRFDAIVVGSRAYETDSALVDNNARLLAYVRNGGLVIVQYQQQVFFNGNFAPFPLKVGGEQIILDSAGGTRVGPLIGHDRVTDETAPVRIIDPRNPVVNRPNQIGPADWEDWIQERGLYFAHTWDEAYTPVLEMADPGEAPLRGGLLVAKYGRGTYVYTGISFFRELPGGVPGAFRLFANLLALGESSVP
jgi:LmbE family N-acetylglucosaminyl deacetylase